MGNLTFNWKIVMVHLLIGSLVTKARAMSIMNQDNFVNGVEIYYTDPEVIDKSGRYGSYSLIVIIDKKKATTLLDMLTGSRQAILSKLQEIHTSIQNSRLAVVPATDLSNEFRTNLQLNTQEAANSDPTKLMVFNEINNFYNASGMYSTNGNPLKSVGSIIESDMNNCMNTISTISNRFGNDPALTLEYINSAMTDVDDGALEKGVISYYSGFEIRPQLVMDQYNQISWNLITKPGYTLMRAVKDDTAYSNIG
jgi:hypothetical protein